MAALVLLSAVRDGHEVTVLERDAETPPAGPEEIWSTLSEGNHNPGQINWHAARRQPP